MQVEEFICRIDYKGEPRARVLENQRILEIASLFGYILLWFLVLVLYSLLSLQVPSSKSPYSTISLTILNRLLSFILFVGPHHCYASFSNAFVLEHLTSLSRQISSIHPRISIVLTVLAIFSSLYKLRLNIKQCIVHIAKHFLVLSFTGSSIPNYILVACLPRVICVSKSSKHLLNIRYLIV